VRPAQHAVAAPSLPVALARRREEIDGDASWRSEQHDLLVSGESIGAGARVNQPANTPATSVAAQLSKQRNRKSRWVAAFGLLGPQTRSAIDVIARRDPSLVPLAHLKSPRVALFGSG
jgi:hypothetical protein